MAPCFRAEEQADKAVLLDWLMSQMRGSGLHMDGTDVWGLPPRVLSIYRAQTPLEACKAAHAQYLALVAEHHQSAQKPLPGAQG